MPTIKRALLSVSDKTGLVDFAKDLTAQGIALLASDGTAKALKDAGCAVTEVCDYTGAPEVLGGRVKTLHPKIHGGILARRDEAAHQQDMADQGIEPIDLVVVNLYPFEQTIANEGVTRAEAIEQIDIGGPTLLRAAAKNFNDVVVLCDPNDYGTVLTSLTASNEISVEQSFAYAGKVFAHVAYYDAIISNYFSTLHDDTFPETHTCQFNLRQPLRYGENPHQKAAWYQIANESLMVDGSLQGKALSYNNLLDTDAAIGLARDLAAYPYGVVVVKHGNPCGVGVAESSLREAFERAKAGDPVSAFGGIVATQQPIDGQTAQAIAETFFEVIAAPSFATEAREIFASKKNLRLVPYDDTVQPGVALRTVCGGLLVQTADVVPADQLQWKVVSKRQPTSQEEAALRLAWCVAQHVRSNAIVFGTGDMVLGVGAGQMSRIDSVKLAEMKMQEHGLADKTPRVAASDAFFPFRDGLDAIANAGMTAVVQPGGSVRDEEVIAAANEHDVAMVCTGIRHFRH